MKCCRWLMIFVGLILAGGRSASAWNDLGHMTVAQIAYRQLSGEERHAMVRILKHHPHFDTYFHRPDGVDIPQDEWLFLRAATWCDFIRPPRNTSSSHPLTHPVYKFHRSHWHYINYPFRVGDSLHAPLPAPLVPTGDDQTDIVRQLKLSLAVLLGNAHSDPGIAAGVTTEQNRAIRLCWLFHLIGDLHQPLHSTALVDAKLFPGTHHSDAGGNLVIIRTNAKTRISNLHAYWDGLLGTVSGWKDATDAHKIVADIEHCRNQAELLSHGPLAAERLPELQQHLHFVDWAEESYRQATAVAYDGGRLQFVVQQDVDEQQIPHEQIPILPPLLQEKARATANKRIALAGYRLAQQIEKIVSVR